MQVYFVIKGNENLHYGSRRTSDSSIQAQFCDSAVISCPALHDARTASKKTGQTVALSIPVFLTKHFDMPISRVL